MKTSTESQQVLAEQIRSLASALNERIQAAQARGLIVEAEIMSTGTISNPDAITVNVYRISRPL